MLLENLKDCLLTITYEMRILINSKRKNLIARDKLILFIGLIFFYGENATLSTNERREINYILKNEKSS